ncbi:MAG TPA: DUF58 domain-containing protein [Acidimicrobiales bacterium]|nr:DUF58 domain-containing protein [Acidimicrobiales bacterium]
MTEVLLEPGVLARLEALQVATRRRLAGHLAGNHRSVRHGTSLDFADYRQYHPGDDFRRIDYHLLARLDVVLLKLFEAEDDLSVRLLVDTSGSMAAGGKLRQAARMAAALGFVGLVRRDAVSVHTFPARGSPPRFVGRAAAPALFDHLAGLRAGGRTDVAAAASDLLARRGPPGLTALISDLLTPEWQAALARLPARGGDVVVLHVLGAEDLRPSLEGDVELVDVESGRRVPVSLGADVVAGYRRAVLAWADGVADRCHRAGLGYVRVMADDDVESVLVGHWRDAGVLRR